MIWHPVGSLKLKEASELVLGYERWSLKSVEACKVVSDFKRRGLELKEALN